MFQTVDFASLSSEPVKLLSCVWLFAIPWIVAYQGSPIHGIFQARLLEWVAISFSRGSSWPRNQTQVSCIAGRRFTIWATKLKHICINQNKNHYNQHIFANEK